jgi:hypothetical protein
MQRQVRVSFSSDRLEWVEEVPISSFAVAAPCPCLWDLGLLLPLDPDQMVCFPAQNLSNLDVREEDCAHTMVTSDKNL